MNASMNCSPVPCSLSRAVRVNTDAPCVWVQPKRMNPIEERPPFLCYAIGSALLADETHATHGQALADIVALTYKGFLEHVRATTKN